MPIGVILVITFGIMAIKRGADWPVAVTAMSLGDRSNGTILQDPIDMVGNLWDQLWKVAIDVFSRKGSDAGALVLHVAQMSGIAS
jgi:hypothetical protein